MFDAKLFIQQPTIKKIVGLGVVQTTNDSLLNSLSLFTDYVIQENIGTSGRESESRTLRLTVKQFWEDRNSAVSI